MRPPKPSRRATRESPTSHFLWTPFFASTGNIVAESAFQYGLETLWSSGPYSLLAEYNHATVDSPALGDLKFSGYYATGSWVITGETRPYDRNAATPGA